MNKLYIQVAVTFAPNHVLEDLAKIEKRRTEIRKLRNEDAADCSALTRKLEKAPRPGQHQENGTPVARNGNGSHCVCEICEAVS
jgi:hypothetical protein